MERRAGHPPLRPRPAQADSRRGAAATTASYNCVVADLGKLLVLLGVLIVAVGLGLMLAGRTNLPLGRLPGDIVYRGKHTTLYFPLATSIVLSVVLSVVLYVIGRFRR